MDPKDAWRERLGNLRVYTRGGERAVHKPLLSLLLIARAERGIPNDLGFEEIEKPLAALLRDFGPPRRSYHPEFPFWHLQSDGVWVVREAGALQKKRGGSSPTKVTLRERDARGYVPDELWEVLVQDADLRQELARGLLESFWPPSLHGEIREAVGLDIATPTRRRMGRNPEFRQQLLMAYERQCAFCGYDGRLSGDDLALEAAHIRWHCYEGPDLVSNGLLLCSFHHVALDRGAMGLTLDDRIVVSKHVSGGASVDEWVGRYHDRPLRLPRDESDRPGHAHVEWHQRHVFRSPSRAVSA
jgi:putative restriction endonuclease